MRYTKAVPFHTISAKTVAQVLFQIISQVALLKEMLTDQGMSFMCRTLKELCKLLGIKSVLFAMQEVASKGMIFIILITLSPIA